MDITSARLYRIGLELWGYDPGASVRSVESNRSIWIDSELLKIIEDLIIKAYPDTADENLMIVEYKKRKIEFQKYLEECDGSGKIHII
jgi:hypothetical protein